jgi:hypothetical protein
MKKFIMALVLGLSVLTASFASTHWHKIKENNNEYYNGDTSELELYIHKDDTSIATLYLSYKEDGCSEIVIYIDIDTERANDLYNKFNNMWSTEFKKYIFDDFAKNSDDYLYNSDDDSYYIIYSYLK